MAMKPQTHMNMARSTPLHRDLARLAPIFFLDWRAGRAFGSENGHLISQAVWKLCLRFGKFSTYLDLLPWRKTQQHRTKLGGNSRGGRELLQ